MSTPALAYYAFLTVDLMVFLGMSCLLPLKNREEISDEAVVFPWIITFVVGVIMASAAVYHDIR